jgi:hypothetical protein
MGTDIHPYVEVRRNGKWHLVTDDLFYAGSDRWTNQPFKERDYTMFGLFAGVRSGEVDPISEPRGLPEDVSAEVRDQPGAEPHPADWGWHTHSWLTLAEVQSVDYDQPVMGWAGGHEPLREYLGDWYRRDLDALANLGDPSDVRIVFWFDS